MSGATDTAVLRIDPERLWESLSELGAIGAYHDSDTDLDGVRRLALTDDDIAGRELVLGWMRDAGLTIRMDAIGNVYAMPRRAQRSLAPVLVGSHIDSVATAGRFDGCLGVLGGLEVAYPQRSRGGQQTPVRGGDLHPRRRCPVRHRHSAVPPPPVVSHCNRPFPHRSRWRQRGAELDRHDLVGDQAVRCRRNPRLPGMPYRAGPILAEHNTEIGVVRGVQAITWLELEISGRAAHAGATPTRCAVTQNWPPRSSGCVSTRW